MIEIESVSYQHRGRIALKAFTARLERGKVYGLMGPNGAGKSTLIKLLAGIYPLQQGRVLIEGKELATRSARERARLIAYVPQNLSPQFGYRVIELVEMGRYPYGEKAPELIQTCLELTEMWPLRECSLLELSGGQLQRAFLARALAQQAPLLLMDEPFTYLDLRQQHNISRILRRYAYLGHTLLITLHDLNIARQVCDALLFLREGELLMQGSSPELLCKRHLEALYNLPNTL